MRWTYLDIRTITPEQFDTWYAMADDARRERCDACRFEADRLRSIAGDHLARAELAEFCGVEPGAIRFGRTADGKPYALDLDAHFNISHSGHLVVCAVSEGSIGIDAEQLRPVKQRLTNRVCTEAELAWLREAPGWGEMLTGEAMIRFFQIWTTKEAYFKWTGTGITDLKSFDTLDHIRKGGTLELDGHMISIYVG